MGINFTENVTASSSEATGSIITSGIMIALVILMSVAAALLVVTLLELIGIANCRSEKSKKNQSQSTKSVKNLSTNCLPDDGTIEVLPPSTCQDQQLLDTLSA